MFVTVILFALLTRYYLQQREAFNAIASQLRENVSADVTAAYEAAYNAGAATRAAYEEYSPKVIDAYNRIASELASRFSN